MALDSYRVRETRNVEETKKAPTSEDLKKQMEQFKSLIDSLPVDETDKTIIRQNSDLDQQWIRENESSEMRHIFANQNQQSNSQQSVDKELDDIIKKMQQSSSSQSSTPDTSTPTLETTSSSIPSSPTPPNNPIPEQPVPKETIQIDNQELISQLSSNIDKKHQFLNSQLGNIYNSSLLQPDVQAISSDLKNIMDIKDRSLDELRKVDSALDSLISRFAKLSQKADEIKATDDFRINQQIEQMKILESYQNDLTNRYGKYWFGKMSDEEKEKYIQLYCSAHKVSRESVEKDIEHSITIAYNEIIAESERKRKEQTLQTATQEQPTPLQEEQSEFKGNYENIIKFNGRQAVETLKQIHSRLDQATPEQIQEFNELYATLSSLSKGQPKSLEEEQQKLTQLYDITDKIDQLDSSLGTVGKTR